MIKMIMAYRNHLRFVGGFRDAFPQPIDGFEFNRMRGQTEAVRAE
jgi:hypothetical protein